MSTESNKENIASGLLDALDAKPTDVANKKSKKTRSLSVGPGSLNAPAKEETSRRRKSAVFPAVKSILSTKDGDDMDEVTKRKLARRKSLAARRVSFAPEATLHTWEDIVYERDATTSTASEELTRRASTVSQDKSAAAQNSNASPRANGSDPSEPPSTPPEQAEDVVVPESSPRNQRDLHQKKRRRRSSGIPPLNFNNPDDAFSSSPAGDSSPLGDVSSDDEMDDETMDLDEDRTGQIIQSADNEESTSSSARLDEALRHASMNSGAAALEADMAGDMTMEMAEDEITHAFKPWAGKRKPRDSVGLKRVMAGDDQENVNPFAQSASASQRSLGPVEGDDEVTQDMSMDMTFAIGGIVKQQGQKLTSPVKTTALQKSLKRRRSSTNIAANSSGSPLKRPNTRRSVSRRQSLAEDNLLGDATMDLTMAVGGIQRLNNAEPEPLSLLDASFEETMDFTMAIGGIKTSSVANNPAIIEPAGGVLEDLSMELTESLGKTLIPPTAVKTPSPRRSSRSPEKSNLPPTVTIERPDTPRRSPRQPDLAIPELGQNIEIGARKSPRKSPRKSMFPGLLSPPKVDATEPPSVTQPQRPVGAETLNSMAPPLLVEPLLEKEKSSSPAKSSISKTASLVDSMKLLSTPRKQVLPSSAPKPALANTSKLQATPRKPSSPRKQATPRHALTPLRKSPQKRVRMDVAASPEKAASNRRTSSNSTNESDQDTEPISLQDFLKMTNIRFMDLTTTRRRATGHPGADGGFASTFHQETEEVEATLENSIAAAVGIVPMISMYQHSCHEMKSYISSGRTEVSNLEAAAFETQPPLFHEYASAPAGEKAIMDAQFKLLKTNARLQSKAGWHAWRSQLLHDLKNGLLQTGRDLDEDEKLLEQMEAVLQQTVPALSEQHLQLESELHRLEERKRDVEEGVGEELDSVREQFLATEKEVSEKKILLEKLQSQLQEKESSIDGARSWKTETIASIKEAERMIEEFRGWSASEVYVLKDKLQALESEHLWSLSSLSGPSITLAHKNVLHLTIHPRAFISNSNTPGDNAPNAPISVSYVGPDEANPSAAIATVRRFFLQLLRAHALSLPQCRTRIADLLDVVKKTWDVATRVEEAVRSLQIGSITDAHILGDEKVAVESQLLLPTLTTKVQIRFEISVAIAGDNGPFTTVSVGAKVVYGEKYDEAKMGEFLSQFVRGKVGSRDEARNWAIGVEDLRGRLLKRGKKDVRV